jgi:hypothetical protein
MYLYHHPAIYDTPRKSQQITAPSLILNRQISLANTGLVQSKNQVIVYTQAKGGKVERKGSKDWKGGCEGKMGNESLAVGKEVIG